MKQNSSVLKIGAAAKTLGVSIDTLRRWEQAGKITAQRTEGGTRVYSPFVKIGEAAKILGVSIDTLRRWERAGKIAPVRTPGSTRLYSLEELRKLTPATETPSTIELLQKKEVPQPPRDEYQHFSHPVVLETLINQKLDERFDNLAEPLHEPKKIYAKIYAVPILALILLLLGTTFLFSKLQTTNYELPTSNDVLAVSTIAQVGKFLEINADTVITGNMAVNGETIFGEGITGKSTLSIAGATTLSTTSVNSTFIVTGLTTATGGLTTPGKITLTNNAAETLLIKPSSDPSSSTKLFVIKNAADSEKVSIDSSGATILSSTLKVSGATTLSSTISVSGATTLSSSLEVSGTSTLSGAVVGSSAGAASAPGLKLTGKWYTGGSATTTKPQLLIEPTDTTSTGWSTSGTGIGVNAASGFSGNLLDLQVAGSRVFRVDSSGNMTSAAVFLAADGTVSAPAYSFSADTDTGIYRSASDTLDFASGGVRTLTLATATSGVNYISITPAATGSGPTIASAGSDTNIPLTINSILTGALTLDSTSTGTVNLGTGNNAKTINIGTGTAGNTINMGTNNTTADTIAIGSALDSLALTEADWSITTAGLITTADDVAINGGDITTTATTFNLVNAATTVNLGSTAVTRTINIGTGTNADTINIGTGGTTADVLTFGNTGVATTFTFNSGATTGTALSLATASLTTGEAMDITATSAPTAGGTQSVVDFNFTNSPSTSANTLRGIDIAVTDGTSLANTIYGIYVDTNVANTAATKYAAGFVGGTVLQTPTEPTYVGGDDTLATASTNFIQMLFVSGRYLYIMQTANAGTCSSTTRTGCELQIYDITVPTSPTYVGGADTGGNNGGIVFVSGRYAYVGVAGNAGTCSSSTNTGCELQIYDVSNPTSPTFVGGANDAGGDQIRGLFVSGHYAYTNKVGDTGTCSSSDNTGCELQIWDVSNPTSPTFVGGADTAGTDGPGNGVRIFVQGRYAYVIKGVNSGTTCSSSDRSSCELQIYDVSNPYSPTYVGGADNGMSGGSNYNSGVFVSGRYAYITRNAAAGTCSASDRTGCEFQILDVSNPASPSFVGGVNIGDIINDATLEVFVSGRYAYIKKIGNTDTCNSSTRAGCELHIYDVSTPSSPSLVGAADTEDTVSVITGGVFVSGRYAYVSKSNNAGTCSSTTRTGCELQVYDISGVEATSVLAHSFEGGSLQVRENAIINNQLTVGGGLVVGIGGIQSQGSISGYVSSASTTADTILAADLSTDVTGIITTGTRSIYGLRSRPSAGAESTGGTTNVYGVYSQVTADVALGGTVNGYGLYVANGTFDTDGTSTQYGLYVESPTGADTNYAAIFAGGRVGLGTTTPTSVLHVDQAAETTTATLFARAFIDNTNAITTNTGNTDVFGLQIDEPNITVGTATPTNSASLYITAAATEASNNYALWVDAGNVRLDGFLNMGNWADSTQAAVSAQGWAQNIAADTQNFSNASSTVAIGATTALGIATLTGDNATLTFTDAATLYIAGIPVASTNTAISNTALALWVDAGTSRFDGPLQLSVPGATGTDYINFAQSGGGTVAIEQHSSGWTSFNVSSARLYFGNDFYYTGAQVFNAENAGATLGWALAGANWKADSSVGNLFVYGDGTTPAVQATTDARSGGIVTLGITGGAHTAVTAEQNLIDVAAQTLTITGAYTTQRFFEINQPTITAASALTVTNSATLYIGGAPVAGGSAAITNPYALWVDAGILRTDDDIVITDGAATPLDIIRLDSTAGGVTVFNEQAADIDFRIESDTSANMFTLDAGLFSGVGQLSIGSAAQGTATAFMVIDNPAITATANQPFSKLFIDNTAAVTVPTGTAAAVSSLRIDEPNITATGTVTNAATVYITDAPTEGANNNVGLWVNGDILVNDAIYFMNTGGTGAADTILYRGGASSLATDDAFSILDARSGIGGGNRALSINPTITMTANITGDGGYNEMQANPSFTGAFTLTNHRAIQIANPTLAGSAVITNNYGIQVDAQTSGGSDYGIAIGAADTYSLWVSYNTDSTAAAGGITFGSSGDTNLYRSAANVLTTDDNLRVAGTDISGTPGLTGSILDVGNQTFTDNATAANGTATNFVANAFATPTLAATNLTVTTTNAATLYIAAAPTAGTNMTITNPYALWVDAGEVRFDDNVGIGVTNPAASLDISSSGTTTNVLALAATAITTGNVIDVSNSSTAATSSDLIQGDHTATYTAATTVSGNLLDLSRALTINAAATTLTVSGAVATLSSNCTQTDGTCTDTGNILSLTQSYASSTGTVLALSNAGTGMTISVTDDDLIGLGTAAGRIEFDDQATDEINFLNARVGIGDATPEGLLTIEGTSTSGAPSTITNISSFTANGMRLNGSAGSASDAISYQSGAGGGGGAIAFRRDSSWNTFIDFYTNQAQGTAGAISVVAGFDGNGRLSLTPPAISGGAGTLHLTPGAHTSVTAETSDFLVNSHTITITGAYASHRFSRFAQPTISAATALTVTNAATVYIADAPATAGAGPAAITNPYALWVDAGEVRFDDNVGIGVTNPAASLDISSSGTTTNVMALAATAITTGSALSITGSTSTGVTTGITGGFVEISSDVGSAGTAGVLLYLAPDFSAGSATTGYGVYNAATDSTAIGNTDYGYYGSLALTGNAAKTGTGIYSTITSTSTTADTTYAGDFLADHNGAISTGTKSVYGIRAISTTDTPTDTGGTINTYGGYFDATGATGGTSTAYGVFIDDVTGADTNYSLYSEGIVFAPPANPIYLNGMSTGNIGVQDIFVSGRYIYLGKNSDVTACTSSNVTGCELAIYDVSNPSSPKYVGGASNGDLTVNVIYVSGRYAYLGKAGSAATCSSTTGTGCELQIFDISNPTSPTHVGGGSTGGDAGIQGAIFVQGRYAYLGIGLNAGTCSSSDSTGCELQIWDISNPSSPTYVGGADLANYNNAMYVQGRYVYIGVSANAGTCSSSVQTGCELRIFDVTNPGNPVYVGGANDGKGISNTSNSLFVAGRYAYSVYNGNAGTCDATTVTGCELAVWDVSDPTNPTFAGGYNQANNWRTVFVSGRYAYITATGSGTDCSSTTTVNCEWQVVDVSNPSSITFVGGGENGNGPNYGGVFVSGRYVYFSTDSTSATTCSSSDSTGCELQIFDISGAETGGLLANSLEAGSLQVRESALVHNQLYVAGGLGVGIGGIKSDGSIGVYGSTSSTTADLLVNFDSSISTSGVITTGTRDLYGFRSRPNSTAASTGGTTNVYGISSRADGTVAAGGTINAYGLYVANGTMNATGTSTNIGLYLEPLSGADTNIGLCFDCDGTWTSSTVAAGIQFGTDANAVTLYRSASDVLTTDDNLRVAGTDISGTPGLTGSILDVGNQTFTDNATAASGTATNFVANAFATPTLAATNTSVTTTNAATFYIAAAPTAGTNQTITNPYALWVDAGAARFDGPVAFGAQATLTADSTTPSVSAGSHFVTANVTNPTLISNFTNGHNGQILVVELGDSATDFDCTASNLNCGGADITTGATGDIFAFVYDGTNWNLINWMDTSATQTGADIAEWYVSSEALEAGDVVSITPQEGALVEKSKVSYDQKTIGIVSTAPGIVLGEETQFTFAVALAGRVPVKVSTENGPIEKGDYLTSSSVPGIAMRATKPGATIGKALESYNNEGVSKILVFVNVSFADPNQALANLLLDEQGNLVIPQVKTASLQIGPIGQISPMENALDVASKLKVIDEAIATQSAYLAQAKQEIASASAELAKAKSDIDLLKLTPPDILLATGSATLANLKATEVLSSEKLLTALDVTVSGVFKALGQAILPATTIAGQLVVDGTFSIDNGSEINTIPTLYLQKNALAAGLDVLNGKFIFNKEGKLTVAGTVEAKQFSVTADSSAGTAILPIGQVEIIINNSFAKAQSIIIVTAETALSQTLAVTNKADGSFKVQLAQPETKDIPFSYLIIGQGQKVSGL